MVSVAASAFRAFADLLEPDCFPHILEALRSHNDQTLQACEQAILQVLEAAAAETDARAAATEAVDKGLSPNVLLALNRNAEQLSYLKQQHIKAKQVAKDPTNRHMWWTNEGSRSAYAAPSSDTQADAVKHHGRFKFFQLPGSHIASEPTAQPQAAAALKFWQTGTQSNAAVQAKAFAAPESRDQHRLQSQKSLTALLFGKARRSSGSDVGQNPSRRASDAGVANWRPSVDISRHVYNSRTNDVSSTVSSAMRSSRSLAIPLAYPAEDQGSNIWASLSTGEGPLSKSHSLLAKPGLQPELVVGKSLECVAEDEREGRDSPQASTLQGGGAQQGSKQHGPTHLQPQQRRRSSSPLENFSFGNRPDEEARSPRFLSRSITSKATTAFAEDAAAGGPLVRSSLAFHSTPVSRVDPFDAPEPQPQPFVEQMRQEDAAMRASLAPASSGTGLMGALRRSISGAVHSSGVGGLAALTAEVASRRISQPGSAGLGFAAMRQQQQLQQQRSIVGSLGAMHQQQQQLVLNDNMTLQADTGLQDSHSKPGTPVQGATSKLDSTSADSAQLQAPQQAPPRNQTGSVEGAMSAQPAATDSTSLSCQGHQQQEQGQAVVAEYGQVHRCQTLDTAGPNPRTAATPYAQHAHPTGSASPATEAAARMLQPSNSPSCAGSRRQSRAGSAGGAWGSSVARQLPMMGQASIDILGRMPPSLLQQNSSRQLTNNTSMHVRLADVYNLTSGNLTPLSAGLDSMKRSHSQGSRALPPRAPSTVTSPRSLEGSQSAASVVPPPTVGPLAAQHSSTMLHARKSAKAAGLAAASPRDNNNSSKGPVYGWKGLGLPTGSGVAPVADNTVNSAAYGASNKYADSWGLIDVATTIATNGGLSRQASAANAGMSHQGSAVQGQLSRQPSSAGAGQGAGLSRQPSAAALQGRLSCQASGLSQRSPRGLQQQQQQPLNVTEWQQQQLVGGAAGRYAGPASSATPTESQSPRSYAATPRPISENGLAPSTHAQPPQLAAAATADAAAMTAAGGRRPEAVSLHRASGRRGSEAGSEDFASADDNVSSASGYASYPSSTGGRGSSGGGGMPRAWSQRPQQQPALAVAAIQQTAAAVATRQGVAAVATARQTVAAVGGLSHAAQQLSSGSKGEGVTQAGTMTASTLQAPTAAQAKVATLWSPNKHASAMAQAPAFSMLHLSPEASHVAGGKGKGLSPRGLRAPYDLSPDDAASGAIITRQQSGQLARQASAGGGQLRAGSRPQPGATQQRAYAGGFDISELYAPSAPRMDSAAAAYPAATRQDQSVGHRVADVDAAPNPGSNIYEYVNATHQQQQRVLTAVDMAREAAMRRTSSSGGSQYGAKGLTPAASLQLGYSAASHRESDSYSAPHYRTSQPGDSAYHSGSSADYLTVGANRTAASVVLSRAGSGRVGYTQQGQQTQHWPQR